MFVCRKMQERAAVHHRLGWFRGYPLTCPEVRGEGFVLLPPGTSPREVLGAGQLWALRVMLPGASAMAITPLCARPSPGFNPLQGRAGL